MLYRIDKNTMLDLPKWKCRDEFRDYYLAKLHHRKDVDLLAKLKARCDDIEERHRRWCEASRIKATRMWQRPGERDRVNWSQAIAVDVFNLDGEVIREWKSVKECADALGMCTSSIIDILNKNRTMRHTGTTLVRLGERRLQY